MNKSVKEQYEKVLSSYEGEMFLIYEKIKKHLNEDEKKIVTEMTDLFFQMLYDSFYSTEDGDSSSSKRSV